MPLTGFLLEFLILITVIGFILYKLLTNNFDYWEKRNVPHPKPIPFFGNYLDVMTLRQSPGPYLGHLYNQFDTPYFGIFVLNKPRLVIKSPELLKRILIKDFNYFCDRTILADEKCDSIASKLLFVVKNPEWRLLRSKMTPAFTSSKVKGMLELVKEASLDMNEYLKKHLHRDSLDMKDIFRRYTIDTIASCALGLQARSFHDENSKLKRITENMFDFKFETAIRQVSYFLFPEIPKFFRIGLFNRGIMDFFRDAFWEAIKLREETETKRNDLVDIIIQMKREQDVGFDFTGDRVVAQAVMYFLAGFETPSTTMAFAAYELCLSPEIQSKARKEVTEVVSKHGGFTYDAVQDLKYLNMVILETLRKYPGLPFLDRMCVKDYKIPDSDLIIEKGISVIIPMFGIHYDPNVYPEPEKFDPERFSEENRKNIPNMSFMPFGEGPRNCLGERFGMMAAKVGLGRMLMEFELERSSDTPVPVQLESKSLVVAAKGGLPVKLKNIALSAA